MQFDPELDWCGPETDDGFDEHWADPDNPGVFH
jgi:hypothetical protein